MIIDAMTDAERRHPNTLIDRVARERIAQDGGATPEEVERLVGVFESWRKPATRRADQQGAFEGDLTERAVRDAPKKDDLIALPARACVAFAARCALRVNSVIESLDEEITKAAKRAIGIAADFAGGTDCDLGSLEEIQDAVRHAALLQQLEDAPNVERSAVAAASVSATSVWAAVRACKYQALVRQRTDDNALIACMAVLAAIRAAVVLGNEGLAEVWKDLNRLTSAVERGEITAETPVPQSFFPAITGQA
jgi:hypothetical protein